VWQILVDGFVMSLVGVFGASMEDELVLSEQLMVMDICQAKVDDRRKCTAMKECFLMMFRCFVVEV